VLVSWVALYAWALLYRRLMSHKNHISSEGKEMTPADIYLQAWICQLGITILYPLAIAIAVVSNKTTIREIILATGMALLPLLALHLIVEFITVSFGIRYPSITENPQEIKDYVFLSREGETDFSFVYLGQVLIILASQVGLLTIIYKIAGGYSQNGQSETDQHAAQES